MDQPTPPHSPVPIWHFPFGPSSKYHQRERSKSHLARYKANYTPTAPTLSTERRAHRRAQSHFTTVQSPSASDNGSSRSPLSRFSSFPANMASITAAMPVTPAKHSRPSPLPQDSPFSDYFTDESARSVHQDVPSSETQQLLVRLHKLQAQLMRRETDNHRDVASIVGRKLDEIECELDTAQTPTRQRDMADSGLFMDDTPDENTPMARYAQPPTSEDEKHGLIAEETLETAEEYKAERDRLQKDLQKLLKDLSKLQTELRQRCAEVREVNERHAADIDERDEQIEQLRMENEGLRSDLGFEYSELLFLKLQMKSLEVQVDEIGQDSSKTDSPDRVQPRSAQKNRILAEIDNWRMDWQDVKVRAKRRRSRYGAISPDSTRSLSGGTAFLGAQNDEPEWQLETVNEKRGRITSLKITRVNLEHERQGGVDCAEKEDDPCIRHVSNDQPVSTSIERPTLPKMVAKGTQTDSLPGTIARTVSTSQSTQTEFFAPPDDFSIFGSDDGSENRDTEEDDNDCAITTSSEDNYDRDDEDEAELEVSDIPPPDKTAWQELCESLANLTGMGDDRF